MKTKIIALINKSEYKIPVTLFFVCALTFGLFIPLLGFYWDDWLAIFYVQTDRMANLMTHYSYDRPLSAWTLLLSGPLLSTSRLAWQLFSLFLRWLSVYLLYLSFVQIFPKRREMAFWIAALFALYPAYTLQYISVAFSQHWISYALFLFSMYMMGKAFMYPERKFGYSVLALFSAWLHLVTLEYFSGLELLRPIYLLALTSNTVKPLSIRIKTIIKTWWPYVALLFVWALWRLFLLEFPIEPHPPILLSNFRAAPLDTMLDFASTLWESYRAVLWTPWQRPMANIALNLNDNLYWLGLIGAVLFSILVFALRKNWSSDHPEESSRKNLGQIAAMGAISIFLGLLPIWTIGESPVQSGYNERFALPAMLGAAILIVALLSYFLRNSRMRSLVFSALLGIAFMAQFQSAIVFREDWNQQKAYFTQLAWRAPSIARNTALIFFSPLTDFMPASATSAALNLIYEQSRSETYADYWYFDLELSRHVRKIEAGEALISDYRGMLFEAQDAEALLYFYQPEDSCLWLLSPSDQENAYLPKAVRYFASFSNPNRVNPKLSESNYVNQPIFDLAADPSWCYAYQQAARLEQLSDWSGIVDEMLVATNLGLAPQNALEWLPLVSAYINLGQWQAAEALSQQIDRQDNRNASMVCATWEKWLAVSTSNEAGQNSWQRIAEFLGCETIQD